jgi:putative membrane protein
MKIISAFAICMALVAPAMAQSPTERTGVNSLIGISPSTQDFVTEAASGDMFEIQSSQIALQKTSDQAVKDFAEQMITDHSKTSAELKSLIDSGKAKGALPTALDSSQQSMLDKLKNLSGSDFTQQYRDDQLKGHKDAVDLFRRYAKGGDNDALKAWAQQTLPTLQHHLEMAQNLDQAVARQNGTAEQERADATAKSDDETDRAALAANQIVAEADARTAALKAELYLTPDQDKDWSGFASSLHDIDKKRADRLAAYRTEPDRHKERDNIIDYLKMQATFLDERSADMRKLSDAAQPLYSSLDEQQKKRFANELTRLSRE